MFTSFLFPIFLASVLTLGANTIPPSSSHFVPEVDQKQDQTLNFDSTEALHSEQGSSSDYEEDRLNEVAASQNSKFDFAHGISCAKDDKWQKLLNDSIEISSTIKNPVERNKMLQFLENLKQQSQQESFKNVSESNYFFAEKQRLQWEEIANKLKSRLNSAQQNLPEGMDKNLIVRILQELGNHVATAIPLKTFVQENVLTTTRETWNPAEYVRNVYMDEWLEYNLAEIKKQMGEFSPTVFISYAWGPEEKHFVHKLADHLSAAGINVRLDKWHNGLSTSIHTEFVTELESVDYIIVVGSKLYGDKCRQNKNNVVIAEARIIAERHKRQPGRILPVLLSDNPKDAFPAFLRDKVFANFSNPRDYPQQLSVLILAACKYADRYAEINQTLQNMVAGTDRIQYLSNEGLSQFSP